MTLAEQIADFFEADVETVKKNTVGDISHLLELQNALVVVATDEKEQSTNDQTAQAVYEACERLDEVLGAPHLYDVLIVPVARKYTENEVKDIDKAIETLRSYGLCSG